MKAQQIVLYSILRITIIMDGKCPFVKPNINTSNQNSNRLSISEGLKTEIIGNMTTATKEVAGIQKILGKIFQDTVLVILKDVKAQRNRKILLRIHYKSYKISKIAALKI